jgi:hypothetical protein
MSDFKLYAILFAAPLVLFSIIQIAIYVTTKRLTEHKFLSISSVVLNMVLGFLLCREIAKQAVYMPPEMVTVSDVWLGDFWVPVYPLAFVVMALFTALVTYLTHVYAKAS